MLAKIIPVIPKCYIVTSKLPCISDYTVYTTVATLAALHDWIMDNVLLSSM